MLYGYGSYGQYVQAVGVCGTLRWYLGYGQYADYPSRVLYGPADVNTNVTLSNETVSINSTDFSLLGLPVPPNNPLPSSVFNDLGSSFALFRYDYATEQTLKYPDDSNFGNMLMTNSYWLLNSSAQSSFTYSARRIDEGDWWVNLPRAGASLVPNPANGNVPWQNVRVCDGQETVNLSEALQRNWLEPTALSYSSGAYQSVDLLSPSVNMLRGYSYVVYPKRDMLALLVPPPGPRTTYEVTGTVSDGVNGISGARVYCDTGSATTDAYGSYSLFVTRTGDMAISASAPGYHTATQVVTVTGSGGSADFHLDSSEVTISVYSSGSINTCLGETSTTVSARVRYTSGDPVSGKEVTFSTTLGLLNGSTSPQVVQTDINGIASVTMTKGEDPEEDAIVTASITSPDLSEFTHVYLGCPPPTAVAIGTGTDQVTLYWEGVSYASGYNIYRSLDTGGPYAKVNDSPVTTVDPGPGLVNRYMFTDNDDGNGLTEDTEYFYYVVGTLSDETEVQPSEEVSAIPSASALPWDTGDPYDIAWAAHDIMDTDPYHPLGLLTICGPNGVIYEENYNEYYGYWATTSPSDGYVDVERAKVVYRDGTTSPILLDDPESEELMLLDLDPYPGADPGYQGYTKTNPPTGIFRKVESKNNGGYRGVEAVLGLPDTSEQYCLVGQDRYPESKDEGWIYVGANGGGWDIEGGLQLGHTGNPGWKPYMRARSPRVNQPIKDPKYPVIGGKHWWVTTGQPARIRLKTPGLPGTPDGVVSFTVESIGGSGIRRDDDTGQQTWWPYCTLIYAMPEPKVSGAKTWNRNNTGTLTIRRVKRYSSG